MTDNVPAVIPPQAVAQTEKQNVPMELPEEEQRIITFLENVVHGDVRKLFDDNGNLKSPEEWDDATAASIAGIDVIEVQKNGKGDDVETWTTKKIKRWDAVKAAELLMKHRGMLKDTTVHVHATLEDLVMQAVRLREQRLAAAQNKNG